ncbi:MAG: hypothetical protein CM15mP49_06120 [Actinomycetota bacterium]|nr:MAG: hypothetical protein CM15mP49_06120 [Actinomycetota bacterium]
MQVPLLDPTTGERTRIRKGKPRCKGPPFIPGATGKMMTPKRGVKGRRWLVLDGGIWLKFGFGGWKKVGGKEMGPSPQGKKPPAAARKKRSGVASKSTLVGRPKNPNKKFGGNSTAVQLVGKKAPF